MQENVDFSGEDVFTDELFPPWQKQDRRWHQTVVLAADGRAVPSGIEKKVWQRLLVGMGL